MFYQHLLFLFASKQFGLFTLRQGRTCGASRGQIARMVGHGVCERVHPGLFRVRAVPTSWRSDAYAAVLVADPLATLVLDPAEECLPKRERRQVARRKARRKPLAVLSHTWALRAHGPADRQRDASKGNRYALLGLTSLWFTSSDVVERPELVIDQLRRALGVVRDAR